MGARGAGPAETLRCYDYILLCTAISRAVRAVAGGRGTSGHCGGGPCPSIHTYIHTCTSPGMYGCAPGTAADSVESGMNSGNGRSGGDGGVAGGDGVVMQAAAESSMMAGKGGGGATAPASRGSERMEFVRAPSAWGGGGWRMRGSTVDGRREQRAARRPVERPPLFLAVDSAPQRQAGAVSHRSGQPCVLYGAPPSIQWWGSAASHPKPDQAGIIPVGLLPRQAFPICRLVTPLLRCITGGYWWSTHLWRNHWIRPHILCTEQPVCTYHTTPGAPGGRGGRGDPHTPMRLGRAAAAAGGRGRRRAAAHVLLFVAGEAPSRGVFPLL